MESLLRSRSYVCHRVLASGSYGTVYLCSRESGENVVIKQVCVMGLDQIEAANEVKIMQELDHLNNCRYIECFKQDDFLYIVMEYCEEGELASLIADRAKAEHPFSEQEIMFMFTQIALAVWHVHSRNILHRDLKSQNIFICQGNILKLGDFGIARLLGPSTELAKTAIGTPFYLSPEICQDQPYNRKSDVWALGCVLYELASLRRAFDGNSLPALVLKILRGRYPPLPSRYSNKLRSLVDSMLQQDPRMRPSIDDILKMAYVKQHLAQYAQHVDDACHSEGPSAAGPETGQVMPAAAHVVKECVAAVSCVQRRETEAAAAVDDIDAARAEVLAAKLAYRERQAHAAAEEASRRATRASELHIAIKEKHEQQQRQQQESEASVVAHKQHMKQIKPKIDKEELIKLGAAFKHRLEAQFASAAVDCSDRSSGLLLVQPPWELQNRAAAANSCGCSDTAASTASSCSTLPGNGAVGLEAPPAAGLGVTGLADVETFGQQVASLRCSLSELLGSDELTLACRYIQALHDVQGMAGAASICAKASAPASGAVDGATNAAAGSAAMPITSAFSGTVDVESASLYQQLLTELLGADMMAVIPLIHNLVVLEHQLGELSHC
eukprot:gene7388-7597_t